MTDAVEADAALAALLQPIPGEDPAGQDLRYDPAYDRIQEARREEDTSTPQGIYSTKLKRSDWATVRDEAVAALESRSKDLQIAVWLLEAWLQLDGLAGLVRGLRVLTALSSEFWPVLYPKLQPDDPEVRLAPFYWLDGKLPDRVGQILVTGRHGPDDAALSWQAMVAAQRLETLSASATKEYQAAVKGGALTVAAFTVAVRATPTAFYDQMSTNAELAADALQALGTMLDTLCGADSPSLRALERAIEEIARFARRTLLDRGVHAATTPRLPPVPAPAPETVDISLAPPPAEATASVASERIASREKAYAVLAEIADFLAVTEPHSPTPYLIRRAIAWGSMGLNELLGELIDEDTPRKTIQRLLQMPEQ